MKIALQNQRAVVEFEGLNGFDGCYGFLNYVHQIYLAYLKPLGVRLGSRLIF